MNRHVRILSALVPSLWLAAAVGVGAQRPRLPQLESPVVNPDRTVTFRFRAPNARQVELNAHLRVARRLAETSKNNSSIGKPEQIRQIIAVLEAIVHAVVRLDSSRSQSRKSG